MAEKMLSGARRKQYLLGVLNLFYQDVRVDQLTPECLLFNIHLAPAVFCKNRTYKRVAMLMAY